MTKKFSLFFLIIVACINLLILSSKNKAPINTVKKDNIKTNIKIEKQVKVEKKGEVIKKTFPFFISIIIDDIGENFQRGLDFWAINDNITLSILPFLKDSIKISEFAKNNNLHVMLHLPMEPEKKLPNYKHFLTTKDNKKDFLKILKEDLYYLPFYEGINNHMGSKLTKDFIRLNWFFKEIKNRNLYFIDSKTVKDSIAADLALKYGILTGVRDFFIDNIKKENYILSQLKKALYFSKKNKFAIVIGHPHNVTENTLRKFLNNNIRIKIIPVKYGLELFQDIERIRINYKKKGNKIINESSSY